MIMKIEDDFDIQKTANCGQCFRAKEVQDGFYRFTTGRHVLYIKPLGDSNFDISCDSDEWFKVWFNYFDLETNYREIRTKIASVNDYFSEAAEFGKGIRILRQDPFETLISFIISQRRSIPSIAAAVNRLSESFGDEVDTEFETVNCFPTLKQFKGVSLLDLSSFGLGYRAEYIHDAVDKIYQGIVDFDNLHAYSDDSMIEELKKIRGVGDKVANCVALFAFHRISRVPIDVWISRVIEEDFHGRNLFLKVIEYAGIAQQYVFYYKKFATQ